MIQFSFDVPLASLLSLDSLFSTQGIMIMLLIAYAGAMWMFLSSAPKVHTIMVSDLEIARDLYWGLSSFYSTSSGMLMLFVAKLQ